MHKNRTPKGLELERKHDSSYKKRLIGKRHVDGKGIINAEYIGNGVYGIVKIFYDDGTDQLIGPLKSFRPTNEDLEINGIILKPQIL